MNATDYTPAQILAGISRALDAGDLPAVDALVRMLAVVSPRDAQAVVDAVSIAQAVHRAEAR